MCLYIWYYIDIWYWRIYSNIEYKNIRYRSTWKWKMADIWYMWTTRFRRIFHIKCVFFDVWLLWYHRFFYICIQNINQCWSFVLWYWRCSDIDPCWPCSCRNAAIAGCSPATLVLSSDCSEDIFSPRGGHPAQAHAGERGGGGACNAEAAGGGGRRRRMMMGLNPHPQRQPQQQQALKRGGHCVSSRSDRYFTKQMHSLGSCPEHSPKGIC